MQHPDGTVTQTRYLPFGGYRDGSGGNPMTDRGYTGHKHNDDLGLIYMNARFYVPGIARFASADTIVPDPMKPQSYNRYSYVLNSPLNLVDPSGHCYEHYEEGSGSLTECLLLVDNFVNLYHTYMYQSAGQDIDKDWHRDNWQNSMTIEGANMMIDHFVDLHADYWRNTVDRSPTRWPERECEYYEPCWEKEHLTSHIETSYPNPFRLLQGESLFVSEEIDMGPSPVIEKPGTVVCFYLCLVSDEKEFPDGTIVKQKGFGLGFGVEGAGAYVILRGYEHSDGTSGPGMILDLLQKSF